MTVKAILWTYDPRQDGSCNIKLYLNHNGHKKYVKTRFHVQPIDFDKKRGLVKKSNPNHLRINTKIGELRRNIETQVIEHDDLNRVGKVKKVSFINFLSDRANDIHKGFTNLKPTTAKSYFSLLKRVTQYQKENRLSEISFDDITLEFYEDFRRFLFEKINCGLPGFSKHIKVIKTIMRLSQDKGLHNNEAYKHHLFKRHRSKASNKIYLTDEEIQSLYNLDLTFDPSLDRERDRFLISYFFLMRFEDSRTIKKENFFQKSGRWYLKYKQQKTGHECIVPVKSEAWEILTKRDFELNHGSNQQSNREIKTVCALARIDSEVRQGEESGPKWRFVTTHTARRSAATNLALQNVSVKIIADLGGWTDIRTLRSYLRASGLDSALVAKDLEFFN